MREECLICKAPLTYLEEDEIMECAICRKNEPSKTRCIHGHYVCSDCHNAGGEVDMEKALKEMYSRGKAVPGGSCGFWGACGAGVSTGQFMSIITGSTPLAMEAWGLSNQMTAKALETLGKVGGPRCCKRDSYLSVLTAIDFAAEHLNIHMEKTMPVCTRSRQNNQCIGKRCPFFGVQK